MSGTARAPSHFSGSTYPSRDFEAIDVNRANVRVRPSTANGCLLNEDAGIRNRHSEHVWVGVQTRYTSSYEAPFMRSDGDCQTRQSRCMRTDAAIFI